MTKETPATATSPAKLPQNRASDVESHGHRDPTINSRIPTRQTSQTNSILPVSSIVTDDFNPFSTVESLQQQNGFEMENISNSRASLGFLGIKQNGRSPRAKMNDYPYLNGDHPIGTSPVEHDTPTRYPPGSVEHDIKSQNTEDDLFSDRLHLLPTEPQMQRQPAHPRALAVELNESSTKVQNQQSSNGAVTCLCGKTATIRTVHKDGPTKGRQFFTCGSGNGNTEHCNFLQWVGAPLCKHNLPCSLLSVKKSGPNFGRLFWTCAQEKSCQAFSWEK